MNKILSKVEERALMLIGAVAPMSVSFGCHEEEHEDPYFSLSTADGTCCVQVCLVNACDVGGDSSEAARQLRRVLRQFRKGDVGKNPYGNLTDGHIKQLEEWERKAKPIRVDQALVVGYEVHDSGSRDEPPSSDFVEVEAFSVRALDNAAICAVTQLVRMAAEFVIEDERYSEYDDAEEESCCNHPWHNNPALIIPCPECGAGSEKPT